MNECLDCGEEFAGSFLDCCPFCESHNISEMHEFQCVECNHIWSGEEEAGEECPACGCEEVEEL